MSKKEIRRAEYDMVALRRTKTKEVYGLVPCGVEDYAGKDTGVFGEYSDASQDFSDFSDTVSPKTVTIDGEEREYVPWGDSDSMPYDLQNLIGKNLVLSQCQQFNIYSLYSQGVRFVDRDTMTDTDDDRVRRFALANSLHETFMEQCTDMKFYGFTVSVLILNREGTEILQIRHKDACFCRFEVPDKNGRVNNIFYGDFRKAGLQTARAYPLLDIFNPLGDLRVRLGLDPSPEDGKTQEKTKDRMFAVVCRIPTPGMSFYPQPYYLSVFRDAWYDIYHLIGIGKRHLIRNTAAPRWQIEIHHEYWDMICDNEGIVDPEKRVARKNQEKRNIKDFVCGVENAGKALISGYYVDPNGKENRMVRVIDLNGGNKKEGGDWSDDTSEAANTLCFAMGVHPNLIGATPGKSQMNNSGSDKRELFTLKQAMEKPAHDIMLKPYHVILHFNKWDDKLTVTVPMMMLTTLDEHQDAKQVNTTNDGDK